MYTWFANAIMCGYDFAKSAVTETPEPIIKKSIVDASYTYEGHFAYNGIRLES